MGEREIYTLEQFQERHGLDAPEAARLFARFGPGRFDLDVLIAKKREFAESARRSKRAPGDLGPANAADFSGNLSPNVGVRAS